MAAPAPAAVGGAGAAAVGGAGAAAAMPDVFSFFGHSMTIGPQLEIPPGCMLVTLALCGDSSYFQIGAPINRFVEYFGNPANAHILADPITNRETIQKEVGMQIGINYPGAPSELNRSYLDTQFNSELIHEYDPGAVIPGYHNPDDHQQKCHIHRSGLYQAGIIADLRPILVNVNDLNTNIDSLKNALGWMFPLTVLHPSRIDTRVYMDRLAALGINGIRRIRAIGAHFQIRQSDLFAMFPGVHYLVTCRGPMPAASPKLLLNMGLRRLYSRGGNGGGGGGGLAMDEGDEGGGGGLAMDEGDEEGGGGGGGDGGGGGGGGGGMNEQQGGGAYRRRIRRSLKRRSKGKRKYTYKRRSRK